MGGFAAPYVPFGAAVGPAHRRRLACSFGGAASCAEGQIRPSTTAAIRAVVGGSRRRQPPAGTGQAPLLLTPRHWMEEHDGPRD
jgi:hypothetical protein